jgi:hypothetical protein
VIRLECTVLGRFSDDCFWGVVIVFTGVGEGICEGFIRLADATEGVSDEFDFLRPCPIVDTVLDIDDLRDRVGGDFTNGLGEVTVFGAGFGLADRALILRVLNPCPSVSSALAE